MEPGPRPAGTQTRKRLPESAKQKRGPRRTRASARAAAGGAVPVPLRWHGAVVGPEPVRRAFRTDLWDALLQPPRGAPQGAPGCSRARGLLQAYCGTERSTAFTIQGKIRDRTSATHRALCPARRDPAAQGPSELPFCRLQREEQHGELWEPSLARPPAGCPPGGNTRGTWVEGSGSPGPAPPHASTRFAGQSSPLLQAPPAPRQEAGLRGGSGASRPGSQRQRRGGQGRPHPAARREQQARLQSSRRLPGTKAGSETHCQQPPGRRPPRCLRLLSPTFGGHGLGLGRGPPPPLARLPLGSPWGPGHPTAARGLGLLKRPAAAPQRQGQAGRPPRPCQHQVWSRQASLSDVSMPARHLLTLSGPPALGGPG